MNSIQELSEWLIASKRLEMTLWPDIWTGGSHFVHPDDGRDAMELPGEFGGPRKG